LEENVKKGLSKKVKIMLSIVISTTVLVIGIVMFLLFGSSFFENVNQKTLDEALKSALMSDNVDVPEIVSALESQSGYEVLSFKENNSEIIAVVKVYAPDIYSLAQDLPKTKASEEEMEKEIVKRLEKAKIVEKQMELTFIKGENSYQPVLTSDFVDAYYGGVLTLKEEMLLKSVEEMDK